VCNWTGIYVEGACIVEMDKEDKAHLNVVANMVDKLGYVHVHWSLLGQLVAVKLLPWFPCLPF